MMTAVISRCHSAWIGVIGTFAADLPSWLVHLGQVERAVEDKFVVADKVIQLVKLPGVPGLHLNDAETVLAHAGKKVLSGSPENIAARYGDLNHEEATTSRR